MTEGRQPSAQEAIRSLLEDWARANRDAQNDQVLAAHAEDARIFDVLPPLQYEGTDAYRKSWDDWQPTFEIPSLFELHDLQIAADSEIGFAHGLLRCGGRLPSGKDIEDWVRATFCFRKAGDGWKIVHQHISMPLRTG